jgi:uncharacterized RDD family membrane protein YckC
MRLVLSVQNLCPHSDSDLMSEPFNPYAPPQANVIPASVAGSELPPASRWHRLLASFLDTILLMLAVLPLEWLAGSFGRMQNASLFNLESILWSAVSLGIWALINWAPLADGQTIGKRVLKIKVVRKDGSPCDRKHNILWRMLPIQVVVLVPVVGMLVALADCFSIFRSSRLTLHDDVAGTKVVDLRSQLIGA